MRREREIHTDIRIGTPRHLVAAGETRANAGTSSGTVDDADFDSGSPQILNMLRVIRASPAASPTRITVVLATFHRAEFLHFSFKISDLPLEFPDLALPRFPR